MSPGGVLASSAPTMWIVVVAVLTVVAVHRGFVAWRRNWVIRDTPASKCAAVFVGRNEVVGAAQPYLPVTSPVTGQPCVWFRWKLERWQSDKNGGHWSTEEARSTAAPFWIVDDTGGVLVRPRAADVDAAETYQSRLAKSDLTVSWWQLRQSVLQGEDQTERARSLQDKDFHEPPHPGTWLKADTGKPLHTFGNNWRLTEWAIHPGDQLYLLGEARPRPDTAALEFVDGDEDLLVSHRTERQLARSASRGAAFGLLLGLVGAVALPALIKGSVPQAVGWMIGVGAAYLGALVLVWSTRARNRLVAVKEQAATAWSMIDVALRRRHDLVPNLVEVTKQYAAHEQQVQTAIAGLRSAGEVQAAERLPSDRSIGRATDLNRAEQDGTRTLLAVAEAYPDLKGDAVFIDLQKRIVHAEDQVAYARAFYNDAVTVLRDRRGMFPGVLFAWSVKAPSWLLFAADDDDRRPVSTQINPPASPDPAPAPAPPG